MVVEAIGLPETYEQAFYARDLAGVVVLVGVPTPDMTLELPFLEVFGRGGPSSRPGTATACRSGTSRCSSISICRAAWIWMAS